MPFGTGHYSRSMAAPLVDLILEYAQLFWTSIPVSQGSCHSHLMSGFHPSDMM